MILVWHSSYKLSTHSPRPIWLSLGSVRDSFQKISKTGTTSDSLSRSGCNWMASRFAAYQNPDTSERETSTTSASPSHLTCIYFRSSCSQSANLVPLRWHQLPRNKLSRQHKKEGTAMQENSDHYFICRRLYNHGFFHSGQTLLPAHILQRTKARKCWVIRLLKESLKIWQVTDSMRLQDYRPIFSFQHALSFFYFASTPLFAHRGIWEVHIRLSLNLCPRLLSSGYTA